MQVLKSGWMEKKGSFVASWKKRWFVLTATSLEYYTSESKRERKGYMPFGDNCSVRKLPASVSQEAPARVKFQIISSERTLEVICPEAEYTEWVTELETVFESCGTKVELESTEAPRGTSELLSYSIQDLREICEKLQIDCQQFTSQQHFITAIKDLHTSRNLSKVRLRIRDMEQECFLASPTSKLSRELEIEASDLFEQLLHKLEVDENLLPGPQSTITLPQKIQYLRGSVRYII